MSAEDVASGIASIAQAITPTITVPSVELRTSVGQKTQRHIMRAIQEGCSELKFISNVSENCGIPLDEGYLFLAEVVVSERKVGDFEQTHVAFAAAPFGFKGYPQVGDVASSTFRLDNGVMEKGTFFARSVERSRYQRAVAHVLENPLLWRLLSGVSADFRVSCSVKAAISLGFEPILPGGFSGASSYVVPASVLKSEDVVEGSGEVLAVIGRYVEELTPLVNDLNLFAPLAIMTSSYVSKTLSGWLDWLASRDFSGGEEESVRSQLVHRLETLLPGLTKALNL